MKRSVISLVLLACAALAQAKLPAQTEEQALIEEAIGKSLRILPLANEGKFDAATMQLHTV